VTPAPIKDWSLRSLKQKPFKIGAKVVSHGHYAIFQMAEVVSHSMLCIQPVQKKVYHSRQFRVHLGNPG
jgi:hypothetical protein